MFHRIFLKNKQNYASNFFPEKQKVDDTPSDVLFTRYSNIVVFDIQQKEKENFEN